MSPLARALMKSEAGDSVVLHAPGRTESLIVLDVSYERIAVEPFREPPGSEAPPMESMPDAETAPVVEEPPRQ